MISGSNEVRRLAAALLATALTSLVARWLLVIAFDIIHGFFDALQYVLVLRKCLNARFG